MDVGRSSVAEVVHKSQEQVITVVSGLPRSGTSMMMKMLEAGGMPVFSDGLRMADDDNPKGYYELEQVKRLDKADDKSWIGEAVGKTVKVISALLTHLPADFDYKVIFIRRKMEEILASQRQMLIRRGEKAEGPSDEIMTNLFEQHLEKTMRWLGEQPHIALVTVNYNDLLHTPRPHVEDVWRFLGSSLDIEKMLEVVDRGLYRQRR